MTRSARMRVASMMLALLMAAGTLLLIQQQRADAAPAGVPAAAASIAGADSVTAQINIQAIVCPILLQIRNFFASSPFFGFIAPILNQFLALFGCTPSP